MAQERKGLVTFKGGPVTLVGPELKAGDPAPDFKALDQGLAEVTLKSSAGKVRLISVVPSLDTGICDQQTRRFNEEAAKLPDRVAVLTVSVDLPFAQKRYCGAGAISRIQTLSDHRDTAFGLAYGVLMKELRLLARAIFVVGADDRIRYVEIAKEIGTHVDYDKALAATRQAAG